MFFAEEIFEWTREPEDEEGGRALKECESHEGEGVGGWLAKRTLMQMSGELCDSSLLPLLSPAAIATISIITVVISCQ